MQLGSRFQQLTVQRAAQVASRAQPQYEKYLGVAQAHARVLDTALADLETQADTLHKQKADGEAFRGERLCLARPEKVNLTRRHLLAVGSQTKHFAIIVVLARDCANAASAPTSA